MEFVPDFLAGESFNDHMSTSLSRADKGMVGSFLLIEERVLSNTGKDNFQIV